MIRKVVINVSAYMTRLKLIQPIKKIILALSVIMISNSSFDLYCQPLKVVEVDLNSGTLKDALPFDVPFQIKGPVGNDIKRIKVWIRQKKNIEKEKFDSTDSEWNNIEPANWKRFEDFSGQHFYIIVPALEVNFFYQFHFEFTRSLTDEEIKEFGKRATEIFDEALRGIDADESTLGDSIEFALQNTLLTALSDLEKKVRRKLEYLPGSVFDTTVNMGQKLLQFAELSEVIIRRNSLINDIENKDLDTTSNYLKKHNGIQIYPQIYQAIRNILTSSRNSFYEQNLEVAALGAKLSETSEEDLENITAGIYPLTLNPDIEPDEEESLSKIWKPEDLTLRIKNLKITYEAFKNLYNLIVQIRKDPKIMESGPKFQNNNKDINRLLDLIKTTEKSFESLLFQFERLQKALKERNDTISNLINLIKTDAKYSLSIIGNSGGTYDTRSGWYVSADAGIAYAFRMDEVLPYFGVNIYLRPVNRDVPLKQKGGFFRRFSFMIGITLKSVSADNIRKDLFGNNALLLGAGYRITDLVRIAMGGILFKAIDPNPLISSSQIDGNIFASISFDWNIAKTFGSLGKAITE